ncbi:unnamed protein product [Cylicocyclus nassatus]|uniref:Condensin-2 complex subunit H2 C-terminal domain-containing protein n=1 Tax=Cylicocyclus nassatus TaxID=53992 RepID=A0AA36H375_CYLNA|nr:unnamed protein product [Cylicocyclus nassatus]
MGDETLELKSVADDEEHDVNNEHRFNFAEAAMLIQGSAFVFGRKVDYVHSQAVHFFEALQSHKTKKKKKGGDEDEGYEDDNGVPLDPCDLLDYSNTKVCNVNTLYKDFCKSKYHGKPPKITVMPMSLMPLADNEKNGVLIYSTGYRKEIVGKMDDFKMNSGFLNSRGVLLLQLAYNKIVDDFASEAFLRLWHPYLFAKKEEPKNPLQSQSPIPDSGRGTPMEGIESAADHGRGSSPMEVARRTTSSTANDLQSARPSTRLLQTPIAESQKMEVDGVDDDGGGCYDDFDTAASMHLPVPDHEAQRPSRAEQRRVEKKPWEDVDDDEDDPTEKLVMDPFVNSKWKTKPVDKIKRFVKGTTIASRLEKVERATMTLQKQTMQTNDYVREHFYMRKKHKATDKVDDWQSDALYRFIIAVMKRRAEAKREQKARAKRLPEAVYDEEDDVADACDDDDIEQELENKENIPPKEVAGETCTAETAGKGTDNVTMAVQTQKSAYVEQLHFGDIQDDDLQNSIDIDSLYGGFQPGESQGVNDEHSHQTKKHRLLAILREHMLKFWSTTEEITSELVTRVQEWEDTMMPILEEEETRKEFDIHEYGNELLSMFKEVGETKTMDELMDGRRRYEISRYFLACLMMVNTYNVKVDYEEGLNEQGQMKNIMRVTLLKRGRHHEVFDKEGAL